MNHLRDENDSLKCQLEAYKNELDMNRQDGSSEVERKNKQITMLQQTLKGMQEVRTVQKRLIFIHYWNEQFSSKLKRRPVLRRSVVSL